ncbi:uncharacterized protein LOC130612180 [Hydractinia symbiolongicarpus]|uniref:uncharacterized protein LOC130612180 n=1 Tax=Hydractinia symbiolongicarpus TaxID=13093 RepID=UPI00254DC85E|nr:uncharacterized protein LOC130612180 [Hydractinia symbiolongicarpus]
MDEIQFDRKRWERKRKLTTIAFALECLFLGMEYSVTFLTLWLYLRELVQTSSPKLFYSFISAAYLVAGVVSSIFIGRLVDRYRNVRQTIFICNFMVIIGNILYALPFSAWFLLFGRLISGIGGPLRSVISGELARCYPSDKLSSKLSIMGMMFASGFLVGPGFNFAFKSVNVGIGKWKIEYVNAPGLYMAVLFILLQIICTFLVFDLSKEYDLKENEKEHAEANKKSDHNVHYGSLSTNETTKVHEFSITYNTKTENNPLIKEVNDKKQTMFLVTKELFKCIDTLLLLCGSFFSTFCIVVSDMWLPMLVVDVMNWSITELNIIVLCGAITCFISMFYFSWRTPSDGVLFILAVLSTIFLTVLIGVLTFLYFYHSRLSINIFMWVVYDIGFGILIILEEIFFIGCLAKMVSSRIQTYAESVRLSMSRLGALTGLLTSATLFEWMKVVGPIYMAMSLLLACLIILRRKRLQRPTLLIE